MKERKVKGKELESKEGRKKARERERASSMRFRGRRRCRIAAVWSGWRNATRRPPAAPAAAPAAAPRATRPRPRTTASCAGLRCAASSPASAPPRRSSNRCRCAAHLSLFFFFLLFLRPHWRPPRLQRGTFISFRSLPVVILLFSPTQQRANSKWKPVPTRDAEYFDFFFHPLPLLLLCGSIHSLNRYIYIAKNRHINHRFLTIVDARAKHRDSRIILARTIFQKQHGTFFFEFLRKNKIASTRSASKRDLA